MTAQSPRTVRHDPVGDTPLVALSDRYGSGRSDSVAGSVWVKWEGANPTGSMKDRMALGATLDVMSREGRGITSVLEEHASRPLIVAVEPAASRGRSGGPVGGHALEGIGLGFVPKTARMDLVDEIEAVSDEEAFATAREIARRDGLLAGPSSGANVAAARRVAQRLGPGTRVCTLLCDTGLRYLAGDLFADEATSPGGVMPA